VLLRDWLLTSEASFGRKDFFFNTSFSLMRSPSLAAISLMDVTNVGMAIVCELWGDEKRTISTIAKPGPLKLGKNIRITAEWLY
jgi:hypothetical protein